MHFKKNKYEAKFAYNSGMTMEERMRGDLGTPFLYHSLEHKLRENIQSKFAQDASNPLTEPLKHDYVLSTVKEAITERVYGTEEE